LVELVLAQAAAVWLLRSARARVQALNDPLPRHPLRR
jgi:hypothetical protein